MVQTVHMSPSLDSMSYQINAWINIRTLLADMSNHDWIRAIGQKIHEVLGLFRITQKPKPKKNISKNILIQLKKKSPLLYYYYYYYYYYYFDNTKQILLVGHKNVDKKFTILHMKTFTSYIRRRQEVLLSHKGLEKESTILHMKTFASYIPYSSIWLIPYGQGKPGKIEFTLLSKKKKNRIYISQANSTG